MKSLFTFFCIVTACLGTSYAENSYNCSSERGILTVTEGTQNTVTLNFSAYKLAKKHDGVDAFIDLLIDRSAVDFSQDQITLSPENLVPETGRILSGLAYVNDEKLLSIKSKGSADFTDYRSHFILNKATGEATLKYKVYGFSFIPMPTEGMNDSLECVESTL